MVDRCPDWYTWSNGVMEWCEECGGDDEEAVRSCPGCGRELCEDCAEDHICDQSDLCGEGW